MNKFTDEYFKGKVEKIFSQYPHHFGEDVEKAIYIAFKEVARDVRHACAEVALSVNPINSESFNSFDGGVELTKNEIHNRCMNL